MNKVIAFLLLSTALPTLAAPLDAFLQVRNILSPAGEANISIDLMNKPFDKLYTPKGFDDVSSDYKGEHLFAGIALSSRLWIDAAYWQRSMNLTKDTKSVDASLDGWQVAGQFTLINGGESAPSLALRAGAWANSTDQVANQFSGNALLKGSSGTASLWIDQPNDEQLQLDIIGSLPLSQHLTINTFASIGNSKVDFDAAGGNAIFNGCHYTMEFEPSQYLGVLAKPCLEDFVVTRFSSPYSQKDINIYKELSYKSQFYQAGFSALWQTPNWRIRGGYTYFVTRRDTLDDIIESRQKDTYSSNHTLLLDVSYRVWQNLFVTGSAQYMHNQFLSEIPLTYNSLSASHFDKHYGLLSAGITVMF